MKTVIEGLQEGLNAIADALEGGGGSEIVPTPTAADEGKVLTAGDDGTASWEDAQGGLPSYTSPTDSGKVLELIEQDMEGNLSPEWTQINEVPAGGTQGQVLTKGASGYSWANPSGGGSYPEPTSATNGQVLTADGLGGASWQTPSGGGGSVSKSYEFISASQFSDGGDGYYYALISTVNLFDAYAFNASYSKFDTKQFVQITSVGTDMKSSDQIISISAADYNAMSAVSGASLLIRVLS